ncbi:metallophosphoesterase [Gemmatimonadota bacterium]
MVPCLFVSDLHGRINRYEGLFRSILKDEPAGVFLGGDLFPSGFGALLAGESDYQDFLADFLVPRLEDLKSTMGPGYPEVFLILGNDDPRIEEEVVLDIADRGLWHYVHDREIPFHGFRVFGYSYVPPTPFRLKDWERYDVSRYTPHGSVSPEEGVRTVSVSTHEARYSTIKEDLENLAGTGSLDTAVFLFHTPPHETSLDRAALDGKSIDYVPLDLHVGSIAVRRFIETRQPLMTLHGHIHESTRLTGSWKDHLGRTHLFSAAHDGPELALVRIDLECPDRATRDLI